MVVDVGIFSFSLKHALDSGSYYRIAAPGGGGCHNIGYNWYSTDIPNLAESVLSRLNDVFFF